jgi:hypothetical protein
MQFQGPGSGIIVHECLPKGTGGDFDFGDAPEEDTAYLNPVIIGHFPTCTQVGPNEWISHGCPNSLFFGGTIDCENDGNAGLCPTFGPNWYNADECGTFPYPPLPPPNWLDEGLFKPVPASIVFGEYVTCGVIPPVPIDTVCRTATWGQDVDIFINGGQAVGGFLNVVFDWNRDGVWADDPNTTCRGNFVPEHVLVNFPVPPGFMGPASLLNLPPFVVGPKAGFVWSRFTLSEMPVELPWDGSGMFVDGESEDYLINVAPLSYIPLSNWAIFIAASLIVLFVAYMWWRRR